MELSEAVAIIQKQKQIAIDIEKKREAAVKYGSKRTKDIYTKIWNEVQQLWSLFLTNDINLTEASAGNSDILQQPYFTEKRKEMTEASYRKATGFILSHYPDIDFKLDTEGNTKQQAPESPSLDTGENPDETENLETGIPSTSYKNRHESSTADFALMKISEVLATQHQFQLQIQQQMSTLMANQDRRPGLQPPRVDIPIFSGQLHLYKSFKDTFLTVANNSCMSNLEKLTLLKSKVSDIALEYISHITIAEKNYEKAWTILDNRFDDPVAIISTSVDKILDMPKIAPNNVRAVEKALNLVQGVANSLELLQIDPNHVVLVRAIIRKLSDQASGELTRFIGNHKEFPTYEKLIDFFINHLSILRARSTFDENSEEAPKAEEKQEKDHSSKSKHQSHRQTSQTVKSHATVGNAEAPYRCYICFEEHLAPACPKLAMSDNPIGLLKHYNVCAKCASHKFNKRRPCIRKIACEICQQEHITALHGKCMAPGTPAVTYFTSSDSSSLTAILLPTAVAKFFGRDFNVEQRILIDVCSQASYVEEQICQVLKLKKVRCNLDISGVGGQITGSVKSMVQLKFEVIYPERRILEVNAFVIKRVTRNLPAVPKDFRTLTGFDKPLADSFIGRPSHVPILLGANIASQLFLDGTMTFGGLLLQNTRLGWMVMGSGSPNQTTNVVTTHVALAELQQGLNIDSKLESFDQDLRKFWDMPVTKDDVEEIESDVCEQLFRTKHYQQVDGRYVVPIPWKTGAPALGDSYRVAVSCYLAQEKRLAKNPKHKTMSDEFMHEYISMGHMSLIPTRNHGVRSGEVYYIPYHNIMKAGAVTTKLRNVFNASAKTSSGVSLNQIIYCGPKLQSKIFDVITRIRQYKFIYSSDITKMYRQILLLNEDRHRLRILYRYSKDAPLQEYSLNTITYGIACAPWQAIRTIQQVAEDHAPNNEVREIISNSFYMDDLFHGADRIEDCQRQISEIIATLNKGNLPLTKWMSNNPDVLRDLEEARKLESYLDLKLESSSIKTLGIQYFPQADMFGFKIKEFKNLKFTKRGMLSLTASLYDPLGWILPVIMMFRILIQKMWSLELEWDDTIECKMKDKFQKFIDCLPMLPQLRIPRWMGSYQDSELEVIGFSDASGDGFAAVIYSRIKIAESYKITLITAKGRVTPLKTKQNMESKLCTIPKMELEGLRLLAELLKEVKSNFPNLILRTTAYTDSQVVIGWMRKSEELQNKFVRSRVNKIKKVLSPGNIHYVKSAENPADAASRGLSADDFIAKKELWLEGPVWMKGDTLPTTPFEKSDVICSNTTKLEVPDNNVIANVERFSSLDRLIGCVSVMLKWVQMFRRKINRSTKDAQLVTEARKRLILLQQQHSFAKEIDTIQRGKLLYKRHWMACLCPYVDEEGFLRVGGRLNRANIPKDQKHPILIPKSHLARLIIRDIHLKNGHAQIAVTDRLLKERYWITGSRNIIRSEIRQCHTCLRWDGKVTQPQMSDLPIERITDNPTFECTAVDFAGPFKVRASRIKFDRSIKAWVAAFVCLSTKLCHLEVCTELSAENFLAAFDRFCSKRSTPGLMVSDNGTNFVAVSKILSNQFKTMLEESAQVLAIKEVKWKFIPPGSPHFGGLHEACVKSFKYFIKRIEKADTLTLEEFQTVSSKIEAILNSRPMYPLSTDPNDDLALTPGHFAVQRCLRAPPTFCSTKKRRQPIPITKRWLLVQQLQSYFWDIYKREYLSTLQKRRKWIRPQPNIQLDDVVIIKDTLNHPLDWPLGKVLKCYPDDKGIVRKVDLSCKNKQIVHRAANKLIPLFTEEEEDRRLSEKPTTRSKSSILNSTFMMIVITIICLLNCCSVVQAKRIEVMTPGIHIRSLGKVNVKAVNVLFRLQTNVNITADVTLIDEQSMKFQQFCESMVHVANVNNTRLCAERLEFLQKEASIAKANILGSYEVYRESRSLSLLSKLTWGGVIKKVGPYAAMAAATGWQEYENWKTRKELHAVEQKFKKVSFILLNISDTETTSLQHQLDNLVVQQQQLILESETNGFTSTIQSLISTVETRHQNLISTRPLEELQNYVLALNGHVPIVRIPVLDVPEDVFTINPIRKFIKGHMVVLQYDIPLCKPEDFDKYAVICSPSDDNESVILDNGHIVQMVVANKDNSSYFFPEQCKEIFPGIYDEAIIKSQNTCTSSLIRLSDYHSFCHKGNWTENANLFPLGNKGAIVVRIENDNISLKCGNQTEKIAEKVNYIEYAGCHFEGVRSYDQIHLDISVNESKPQETIEEKFSPLSIEQHTVPSVEKTVEGLRSELEGILNENIEADLDPKWIIVITVAIIIAILLCISAWVSFKIRALPMNPARDIALQSWTTNHQPSNQ